MGLGDGLVVLGVAEGNIDDLNRGSEMKLVVGVDGGDTNNTGEN